jgi:hypothetical protein
MVSFSPTYTMEGTENIEDENISRRHTKLELVPIFTIRGPFLTSPLGANFDPRGEVVPHGGILSPRVEVIPWG